MERWVSHTYGWRALVVLVVVLWLVWLCCQRRDMRQNARQNARLAQVVERVKIPSKSVFWVPKTHKGTPGLWAMQPFGFRMSVRWQKRVEQHLWRSLQVRVRWLPVRSLPKQAWSEEFRRYRAERLCRFLASVRPDWASRIVGWTWEDISTTLPGVADQAVFGLADRGGPAAMLSGFRLRRLSSLSSMERAWDALLVHEAGHLLSLGHCVSKRCVMRDCAGSLRCLVGLRRAFCRACRHVLKR